MAQLSRWFSCKFHSETSSGSGEIELYAEQACAQHSVARSFCQSRNGYALVTYNCNWFP